MKIEMQSIGYVENPRKEIQDDYWGQVESKIILDETIFKPDATANLESFSHLEVIFYLDRISDEKIELGSRHPRNNPSFPKVGIFGQRTKNRFNKIGVSRCKLLKVEGLTLTVRALDAISGTPILDIKPLLKSFLPEDEIIEPDWTKNVMKDYYKD
ncbi:SAM-dependent methyltransferase [Pseudobacteriovorax antillogorgiicola]|uniref:tRNA-Thr(GGU) m(6)t(6)A37 methyltransferase TsaA n=1 Tax=Pseudobacteriovorax antillogorgiicola TaxID=1513793 RepID=A0A1Y6CTF8_9BACT|nr:SAM-dependent methyltransferase [Pseudobacteriovorax antillogorgiicola]TCS44983.1 tRNA-Thr(GGU) m(6)t(6)A37 methyltransferase TsaA [Pseudobacteriovorax antillogorgiicola]SMF76697.1 tRNA-Thr(GGU) m(6)t(6)A37 methyltransferase TsaA [Pseudobacteriovorax antillogorgiicola]